MFNQVSNEKVRERLVMYLSTVADECDGTKGGVIAETLLGNINKYARPYCSEHQAYAVAETAYENNIQLL